MITLIRNNFQYLIYEKLEQQVDVEVRSLVGLHINLPIIELSIINTIKENIKN